MRMHFIIKDFVASELVELETRDPDALFDCIKDNLESGGVEFDDDLDALLYAEIEDQLKGVSK